MLESAGAVAHSARNPITQRSDATISPNGMRADQISAIRVMSFWTTRCGFYGRQSSCYPITGQRRKA
jgi:hypothetical protein